MSRHGRTNSRTTEVHDIKMFLSILNRLDFVGDREAPAVEFLTQGHRHSVLQVRTTHLQNGLEFVSLLVEGSDEVFNSLQHHIAAEQQGNVESGRIRVVGGLTEVSVVVRRNQSVVTLLGTQLFSGQVADDFIAVHVRGRTGTTLDPVGHELIMVFASDQLVASPDQSVSDVGRDRAEFLVGHSSSLLHIGKADDEERFLSHGHFRHMEVFLATKGLHTIVAIIRNFLATKEVIFNTRHVFLLLVKSY